MSSILAFTGLLALVAAQQIGKTPEVHPKLPTQLCTTRHGCVTQQTSVVLDALTHSIQNIKTGASCENSTGFPDQTICPNAQACGRNCAIQGINDYSQHGVTVSGNSMTLHQYLNINGTETSVSPRVYLLAPGGQNYDLLKLTNQEFTFTVDVSNLPCGMNGALYLSEMSATGGRSALNPAGAAYGTGYCDAQCPKSAWINGVANINDNGACCNEMDIWEANAVDTQFTPHACNVTGLYECSGALCSSNGVCDQIGCGYNSYAYGNKTFYGYNDVVNTNKPFTVVTQFHTNDGTATGTLSNITRLYIQNNKIIQNAVVQVAGMGVNSIEESFCEVVASSFQQRGGLAQMGKALERGMVLAMSIWNDPGQFMNWLDSGSAGPCNATEGNPALIEANDPTTSVTFSDIRIGDIGSTFSAGRRGYRYYA